MYAVAGVEHVASLIAFDAFGICWRHIRLNDAVIFSLILNVLTMEEATTTIDHLHDHVVNTVQFTLH